MAQVTGIIYARWDGALLNTSEVRYNTGGFERTAQYADGRHLGPSQQPIAATATLTLKHTATLDLAQLTEGVGHNLEIVTDTGVVWLSANAYVTNPPEVSSGEGNVEVEIMADPGTVVS